VLGVGLSVGMVFALMAVVFAAPAAAGEMEWTPTNTPSWEDFEILPDSDIIDYDIGEDDGSVVFAAMGSEAVLGSVTGGTATWSTVTAHTGGLMANSALLTKTGSGSAGSTHVEFAPIDPVTFARFADGVDASPVAEWSFWHYYTGLANGPQFELRFEDPDSDAWIEVTAFGLQNTTGTGAWTKETLIGTTPSGYGGVGEAGASFFDMTLDTLVNITADVTGEAAVTDPLPWILTRVRTELWETSCLDTYIDDVTANGICYPLEPMPMLVESDDGGITWTDITAKLQDASNLPAPFLNVTLVAWPPMTRNGWR